MGRLPAAEKVLAGALLAIWAVTFSIATRDAVHDAGLSPFFASASSEPHGYPTFAGWRPYSQVGDTPLRRGDRLLRVGAADLRGAGPLGVVAHVGRQAAGERKVSLVFERDGLRRQTEVALEPVRTYWPMLSVSLVLALCALAGLLRAAPTPVVRLGIPAFLLVALEFGTITSGGLGELPFVLSVRFVATSVGAPLVLYAALRFPSEQPLRNSWERVGPALFGVRGVVDLSGGYGALLSPDLGLLAAGPIGGVLVAFLLLVLTRNYLRADTIGRRQLRWVLFSVYLGLLPVVILIPVIVVDPSRIPWMFDATAALAIAPLGLVVAMARYNLFDVDRLLSAAASYNILIFAAVAAGLLALPHLAEPLAGWVGVATATAQTSLALAIAAAVIPAQRRLRPALERVLFPERHAVDAGAAELLRTLAGLEDSRALTGCLGTGLSRLFRPESCVIYAPSADAYAPVFSEGRTVPAAFEAQSPLIATLRDRRTPLAVAGDRARDRPQVGPFDRAVLETLGAAVVVPIAVGETPALLACLGAKRSGDVYTPTDLQLLAALADRAAAELLRFDHEQVIAEATEMQRALRRYVPGAIAEQIESGEDLHSGAREVSVLFVDIRGYTSYSESRSSEEIFSTVNRYTETVSEILRKHGGSVVEFNGDGMMAIFGAPRALDAKEDAALAAGRELPAAVSQIERGRDAEPLGVGVGIATGEAFVGNIHAVDRTIWTAIGHTTNLAARLQALTRELDSDVVIDEATRRAVGGSADDFTRCEAVPIRGLRESATVYRLPASPRRDP